MSERPRKSFPSRLASSFIRVWTSPAHPAPTPPYVTYICGSSVGAPPWENKAETQTDAYFKRRAQFHSLVNSQLDRK